MKHNSVWYRVPDHCAESWYQTETLWGPMTDNVYEQEAVAETCARDYESNHDCGGDEWTLGFAIYATKGGPLLFACLVSRQLVVQYSAKRASL